MAGQTLYYNSAAILRTLYEEHSKARIPGKIIFG